MAAGKMRTRGKGSVKTAAEAVATTASTVPKVQLQPESSNPPKVFVLPRDATPEARILTLPNPRTALGTRYYCCPNRGFYEFTRVAELRTIPRSWLLAPCEASTEDRKRLDARPSAPNENQDCVLSRGYVTKTAEMFIATPIDPLFLILPALAPSSQGSESAKQLFLSSDDYLDKMASNSPHFRTLLRLDSTQKRIEERMAVVCDTVEAGDEDMYRLNEIKLLRELARKAKTMVEHGLPSSMEEKFVAKALEAPMLSLKREESSIVGSIEDGVVTPATLASESVDSQNFTSSIETLAKSASFASTAATSLSEDEDAAKPIESAPKISTTTVPEDVPHLLRLRTALNFIITSYLPPHLQKTVQTLLQSPASSSIDFTSLNTHLSHLAELREQALASRSLGDYSRKRLLDEDEETRAEKKQKKDEEEKRRKAGESRGVKELKKVNVKGMKKMSDFFAKKV